MKRVGTLLLSFEPSKGPEAGGGSSPRVIGLLCLAYLIEDMFFEDYFGQDHSRYEHGVM